MQVFKTLALASVEMKFSSETGSFEGYASVWDGVDSYQDTIKKGAFLETLRNDGLPKMFFDHKRGMPVGKYTDAGEDAKGLYVKGELTPNHSLANDVRAALQHGSLDGLSIGGLLRKGDYKATELGGRVIHKWSRLVEVSPVVFPADSAARINADTVKHLDFETLLPECKTERDIEQLLRDAGLGKWEAMAIVSRAKAIYAQRDAGIDVDAMALEGLAKRMQALANASA